jgi:hypothetical protein
MEVLIWPPPVNWRGVDSREAAPGLQQGVGAVSHSDIRDLCRAGEPCREAIRPGRL